ncbi:hypothetical protein AX774_g590 [Zancudomyces culisetae]|uniref:Uncharacterized protein n=1 Tax=Zancudomyces culisetae TaxID=1213189 RepID=A0A1R1PXY9_ZANCU|nr:hypothetical protein AX774_g590 [Zancudomyces culisetae]|eukprot:OMH85845.1 hypothetical protein AX774_g590 [Zancudomyces culisetae]
MTKAVVLSILFLGSSLAALNKFSGTQQLGKYNIDDYNLKIALGKGDDDEDEERKRKRRIRGLGIELFRETEFKNPIKQFDLKPNECYNVPNIYSLKVGSEHKYKGAIVACVEEDCNGKCRVLPRRISSSIPYLFDELSNSTASSVTWINPYY